MDKVIVKKVVLVSSNADEAGAPRHVESLVNRISDKWHVSCIFGESGPVAQRLDRNGTKVTVIHGLSGGAHFLNSIFCFIRLVRHLRREKPELVHCHSSKAGVIGRLAAWLLGLSSIYTVHGWGWRGMHPLKARIIIFVERILARIPKSKFIFVSNSVAVEANEYLGAKANNGVVIYNWSRFDGSYSGFDAVDSRESLITILMPARVAAAKDHKTLLQAFERLPANFRLILCGDGTNSREFQSFAFKYAPKRIGDIQFMGQSNTVEDLYKKSDICVLSSKFEAMPLCLIEAMAFGIPIVGADVGGVSEIITDGYNGKMFPSGNYIELANCLQSMIDLNVRKLYGSNGRKVFFEKFSESSAIDKTIKVYNETVCLSAS